MQVTTTIVNAAPAVTYRSQPTEPVVWGITNILEVGLEVDEDHDTVEDSFAAAYDLPLVDAADTDLDGDGLTNLTERTVGTDPDMVDTDGDDVSDGDEVSRGSNPLDPDDVATSSSPLVSIHVTPHETPLTYNTVYAAPTVDLRVTAQLADGSSRDVTGNVLTTYRSLSTTVATVSAAGRVTGIADGTAQIMVQHQNKTDLAKVTVATFAPRPISAVPVSGFAYRVAVRRDTAYVAAGAGGLVRYDVSDPVLPDLLQSVPSSDARDVALYGKWAFVADATDGLVIADATAGTLVSALPLSGSATGVAVSGGWAYVAIGSAGISVVDVNDPTAPEEVEEVYVLALAGSASDLALDEVLGRLVVADETGGIHLLSIADDPTAPTLIGSSEGLSGQPRDVAVRGVLSWIASYTGGAQAWNMAGAEPAFLSRTPESSLVATGVDLAGELLFVADLGFVNNLPIYNVKTPASPAYVAQVDFSQAQGDYAPIIADSNHYGVAVNKGYVFVAAGDGGLQIGQYVQFNDAGHVAPRVAITAPAPETTWVAGSSVTVGLHATDDVAVASFEVLWDGVVVAEIAGTASPTRDEELGVPAPPAFETRTALLGARATDLNGNVGEAQVIDVFVSPPVGDVAAPLVEIISPDENATFGAGRAFVVSAEVSDDVGVAWVEVGVGGTVWERRTEAPYDLVAVMPLEGSPGDSVTLTVRAMDYAQRETTATRTLLRGDDADEILSECIPGSPVFELGDDGTTGVTSGSSVFACVSGAGSGPERIYTYAIAAERPLRSLTFSTIAPETTYDTVLYVRQDLCADPATEVDCNNDYSGSAQSQVTLTDPATGLYYVFVDGAASASGTFGLTVSGVLDHYALCADAGDGFACTRGTTCREPAPGEPEQCLCDEEPCPACSVLLTGADSVYSNERGCYLVFNSPTNWTTAEASCQSAGSGFHLVAISNAEENTYVRGLITDNPWIGNNDVLTEVTWVWASGELTTYTNWSAGEPNNWSNEDCGMLLSTGKWNDAPCSSLLPFVCAEHIEACGDGLIGAGEDCDDMNDVAGDGCESDCLFACGTGSQANRAYLTTRGCYLVYDLSLFGKAPADWATAEASCQAAGSGFHLVTISNSEEDTYVHGLIAGEQWLGFSDTSSEGIWTWASGELTTYTNWSAFEPNNAWGNEDCGMLHSTGKWNDVPCSSISKYRFVCAEHIAACGDGVIGAGEDCDDMNAIDGDGCESDCRFACGAGSQANRAYLTTRGCYLVYDLTLFGKAPADWATAEASCQAAGSGFHLVTISNSEEDTYVHGLIAGEQWLGFSDTSSEGIWTWASGELTTYTNWSAGEPNNAWGNEDCGMLHSTGKWNDVPCSPTSKYPFVCDSRCGNSEVDAAEDCDDGNWVDSDGCESGCTTCGDGVIDDYEACDDGNRVNGDGCESDCSLP